MKTIQKCQNCSEQFTWKAIQKSLLWGYKPISCTNCSSTHDISFMSRIGLVLFTTAIPMLLVFNPLMDLRIEIETALYLLWVVIVIGIAPLFVKYSIK
ncbi:TIGR04104 family putative zinc finger protein [Youngiibacter multivorans]